MTIHADCRHYRSSVPCRFHKATGVRCDACADYAPVEQRILVVKLDAMGDVLRTTALLPPLKRLFPRSEVTWITRAAAAPLVRGNPHVDRVLAIEAGYLAVLLTEDFDLALGPDADPLSASIMQLARAATKRGFVSDRRGGVTPLNDAAEAWWRMGLDDPTKRGNRRTYGDWLYAICELPGPVARPCLEPGPEARERAARFLRSHAPSASQFLCFNTGASGRWEEKRWKVRHYGDFAALLRSRDPQAAIVLVGGPDEAELNARILASTAGLVDGGTGNSLDEFAALVASCDWILTPDSLGYHVACAVGTPALCLAGPTSPWELDLYGTNQVLHADLPCTACYLAKCPFDRTCMDALSAEAVWLHARLERTSPCSGVVAVAVDADTAAPAAGVPA